MTTTNPGSPRRFAAASLWVGIALIAISIYFFLASVTLISPPAQAVVAALLSAIIGFVMLSAGTTLVMQPMWSPGWSN